MSVRASPIIGKPVVLPPEIAFLLAEGVPPQFLARAASIAREDGTDAATALLNTGLISEEAFYRALARRLRTDYLDVVPLAAATRYPHVVEVGAAPLAANAPRPFVAAPRGHAITHLIETADKLSAKPAITTPTRLRQAAFARHADEIADAASNELGRRRPEWSCLPGPRPVDLAAAALLIASGLVLVHQPVAIALFILAVMQIMTLAMLTVRLSAVAIGAATETLRTKRVLRDDQMPAYTVMIALYREAKVVPRLIHALANLDYPTAKLQLMFIVESGDEETAAALRAAPLPARFEVVVAPPGLPRTKPRALNVALPLARGELLVVYDAEDVVDPMQLRHAAGIFARSPGTLAALQGRLVIDNPGDGLLARLFAIEYSALFDVLGPALAFWRMPTPLGGTSTHFRTRVLRQLHGWDAWNVTEDADLGMRLALAGYHVGDLPSATFEEAPKSLSAWLRQRTRWMKGFLQTSWTLGRRPIAIAGRLGAVDSLCMLTLLPGTVASALVYPFVMPATLWRLLVSDPAELRGLLASLTHGSSMIVFVGGFAAMLLPGALGCIRRGWLDLLPFVLLLPVYFLLVSLAAWLAVFELARHPHRWNKTEHGLSRTSRSGALQLRRRRLRAASQARRPSPAAAWPG